jgi:hypothetical protein
MNIDILVKVMLFTMIVLTIWRQSQNVRRMGSLERHIVMLGNRTVEIMQELDIGEWEEAPGQLSRVNENDSASSSFLVNS